MSMEYIRGYYGVPAKRGGRVAYTGEPGFNWVPITGTIVASDGQYLKIRLDGDKHAKRFHPTWKLTYLDESADA